MTRLKITILCLFLWLTVGVSLSQNESPKLVLGIVIEDLRADCLSQCWNDFSDNGFRLIFDNGASTLNLSIPYYSIDAAPDYVSVFTGVTPSIHGIIANQWYNRHLLKMTDFNAERFTLSTLADELKQKNPNSKVIVVSHNALQTFAMAGKNPDAAVWLDNTSSFWKSNKLPEWAAADNRTRPLGKPEVPVWQPLQGAAFSHSMRDYQGSPYYFTMLKTTPWANNEVTTLAQTALMEEHLDRGTQPNMLLVGFSAKDFSESRTKGISPELKDIYLRIDRHIADLILTMQGIVSQKNMLVFIVANQSNHLQQSTPAETVSEQRISSLLNLFLMAKYGQAQWVKSFVDNQIYLNYKEINAQGYRVDDVSEAVVDFLSDVSGVQTVCTSRQLENMCGDALFLQMQKAYNRVNSGDVLFAFAPGRLMLNEHDEPIACTRNLYADIPFAVFGSNIKAQKIGTQATILDIAPTIARILYVNKPNGSVGKALILDSDERKN